MSYITFTNLKKIVLPLYMISRFLLFYFVIEYITFGEKNKNKNNLKLVVISQFIHFSLFLFIKFLFLAKTHTCTHNVFWTFQSRWYICTFKHQYVYVCI